MKFFIAIVALATVANAQKPIAILRQAQDISPEGSYTYSYETENGISAGESGQARVAGQEGLAIAAQGQFQYTAPDGTPISVSYVADENGFQPQGAHLPVAPAIPEAIQRALAYIAAHPQPQQQQHFQQQHFQQQQDYQQQQQHFQQQQQQFQQQQQHFQQQQQHFQQQHNGFAQRRF